jgi:RNA polymerase sigma-70 factor (ECF subfamily)
MESCIMPMSNPAVARELLRNRESLFAFILALVRDFNEAEELFQEISLRILERAGDFEPGTNFGAWAREFARRTLRETRRTRARLVLTDKALDGVAAGFEAIAETAMLRKGALDHCLGQLDADARRLVDLRYDEGLSMETLAARTSRKAVAVQVALSRIRSRLAACVRSRLAGEATP